MQLEKTGSQLKLVVTSQDVRCDHRFKGLILCAVPDLFIIQNEIENNRLLMPCFHLEQMGFVPTAEIKHSYNFDTNTYTFTQDTGLRGMGRGVQVLAKLREGIVDDGI